MTNSPTHQRGPKLSKIEAFLDEKLSGGGFVIGQVRVEPDMRLHHVVDRSDDPALEIFHTPISARQLALYTDSGQYRPLKSAPTLRTGWRLDVQSVKDLHLALDAFYPAAIGMWLAFRLEGQAAPLLKPTSWRGTLSRQTGMYRVVQKITDEQSKDLIGKTCNRECGCLRHILWDLDGANAHGLTVLNAKSLLDIEAAGEIPILCAEACNLLVAGGRKVVAASR